MLEATAAGDRIQRVAVVGTGVIGASWAAYFLSRGLDVAATDPTPQGKQTLYNLIERVWPDLIEIGLARGASLDRLSFTSDLSDALQGAEWVQESGPERIDVKRKLFAEMDQLTPAQVILSTSSSGLFMSEIQAQCEHPQRCLTGHPFNPPHLIPAVEVVGGRLTGEDAIARAISFMKQIGKRPVRLHKEVKGHVANRLQAALWRECVSLVSTGVISVCDIDELICSSLGPRWAVMGPNLLFHLGGGEGGLRHFLEHLGTPFSTWWNDLGEPELTPEIRALLVAGVLEEVEGSEMKELEARRDRMLTAVLKLTGRGS